MVNAHRATYLGCLIICILVAAGIWHFLTKPAPLPAANGPVYAYADVEHIMMSHPGYAVYHRLELERNAMVAQYQFEQWNYSRQASRDNEVLQTLGKTDIVGAAAAEEELKAKVALKEADLNASLQQKYEAILKEKEKQLPALSETERLKALNLQLQLNTLVMSAAQREAARNELIALLRKNGGTNSEAAVEAAEAEMEPYKKKAEKELEDYIAATKADLQSRQDGTAELLQKQLASMRNMPDPVGWNDEWKKKLADKEQEMNDAKEVIMADIRARAADVALEQGIDMIFSDYAGIGTALDVSDDIIAKLA